MAGICVTSNESDGLYDAFRLSVGQAFVSLFECVDWENVWKILYEWYMCCGLSGMKALYGMAICFTLREAYHGSL